MEATQFYVMKTRPGNTLQLKPIVYFPIFTLQKFWTTTSSWRQKYVHKFYNKN